MKRKIYNSPFITFHFLRTIELSVDISKTAHLLISMLKKVSKFQDHWYESAVLKQMITRYYRFMQLKTVYFPNILLIPTLDVEVVWQTHLLRPEIYRSDCLRLFHHIVDHSLLATEVQEFFKEQAFVETCQLYEERFGEQYCPLPKKKKRQRQPSCYSHYSFDLLDGSKYSYLYWDETLFQFSSYPPKNYENPFSFTETEIILDSCWLDSCKIFMHDAQDRVPIDFDYDRSRNSMDLDYGIIQRLKKLYERFLYMAAKYPLNDNSEFISPTYAVNISSSKRVNLF